MKNLNLYLILGFATLLSACSSNKDLATLDEYDDIYYSGQPALTASLSSSPSAASNMDGASDAERSYYENVPYSESSSDEVVAEDQDDYYEEDYAARIDNFHRENDGDYLYSSPSTINSSPTIRWNMMYGMGSYGSSFGLGFSYGSPGYGYGGYGGGYPYYNPYMPYYPSPWYRPYPYYGYYDPFYPTYGYGYGFGYGYSGYGGYYGGGGYYGSYPPYYGGGDYHGSSGITSTLRQSASSVRPSRGGIINQNSESDGRKSVNDEAKSSRDAKAVGVDNSRRSEVYGRRENVELRPSGVQNSEALSRENQTRKSVDYTRPGTSRSDYTRSEQQNRQTRPTPSPTYTPERSNSRNVVSPAQRSNSVAPSNVRERSTVAPQSRPARTSPSYNRGNSRSASPSYNSPSRNSSPSRSVSPSRSNDSGGSAPSSSPSRGSRR